MGLIIFFSFMSIVTIFFMAIFITYRNDIDEAPFGIGLFFILSIIFIFFTYASVNEYKKSIKDSDFIKNKKIEYTHMGIKSVINCPNKIIIILKNGIILEKTDIYWQNNISNIYKKIEFYKDKTNFSYVIGTNK